MLIIQGSSEGEIAAAASETRSSLDRPGPILTFSTAHQRPGFRKVAKLVIRLTKLEPRANGKAWDFEGAMVSESSFRPRGKHKPYKVRGYYSPEIHQGAFWLEES